MQISRRSSYLEEDDSSVSNSESDLDLESKSNSRRNSQRNSILQGETSPAPKRARIDVPPPPPLPLLSLEAHDITLSTTATLNHADDELYREIDKWDNEGTGTIDIFTSSLHTFDNDSFVIFEDDMKDAQLHALANMIVERTKNIKHVGSLRNFKGVHTDFVLTHSRLETILQLVINADRRRNNTLRTIMCFNDVHCLAIYNLTKTIMRYHSTSIVTLILEQGKSRKPMYDMTVSSFAYLKNLQTLKLSGFNLVSFNVAQHPQLQTLVLHRFHCDSVDILNSLVSSMRAHMHLQVFRLSLINKRTTTTGTPRVLALLAQNVIVLPTFIELCLYNCNGMFRHWGTNSENISDIEFFLKEIWNTPKVIVKVWPHIHREEIANNNNDNNIRQIMNEAKNIIEIDNSAVEDLSMGFTHTT